MIWWYMKHCTKHATIFIIMNLNVAQIGAIPNIFTDTLENAQDERKEKIFQSLIWQQIISAHNSNDTITAINALGDEDMSTRKEINNDKRPATIAIEMKKLNKTKCKFLSFVRHISSISIWKTILFALRVVVLLRFLCKLCRIEMSLCWGHIRKSKVLLPIYCRFALFRVIIIFHLQLHIRAHSKFENSGIQKFS